MKLKEFADKALYANEVEVEYATGNVYKPYAKVSLKDIVSDHKEFLEREIEYFKLFRSYIVVVLEN